jgi:hypothetical protein
MMANLKKSKKITGIWGIMIILLISACLMVFATNAMAESLKCKLTNNAVKVEFMPIGDEKGHAIGVYENRGLMIHENGEVATEISKGTFESIEGINYFKGYCVQTFEDDSTIWMKYEGSSKLAPNGKGRVVEKTDFEIFKGTGRFKGIKGSGTFQGGQPAFTKESRGYWHYDFMGTYTLPPK